MLESGMKSASEASPLLGADGRLERHRLLADLQSLFHARHRHLELHRDLLWRGFPAVLLEQGAPHAGHAVHALDHVHGDADRARLVGQRARDRLADPPGGVGGELEAAAPVELLDRADQTRLPSWIRSSSVSPRPVCSACDRHDEAEVGLHERVLRRHVVALGAAGEAHLVLAREQTDLADLLEVEANAVLGAALRRRHWQARG